METATRPPPAIPFKMASTFLYRLMHHVPVRPSLLGPEDTEAYAFANALRAATLERRLKAVWTHPANELALAKDKKMKLRAGIARALGLITGTSDYLFMWDTGSMAIEFKSKTGSMTANQRDFRDWCELCGVPFHIVRSAADGKQLLREAGVWQ